MESRLFWLDCHPGVMNITGVSVGDWRQIDKRDRQRHRDRDKQTDRETEKDRQTETQNVIPFYLFILSLFPCVAHTL